MKHRVVFISVGTSALLATQLGALAGHRTFDLRRRCAEFERAGSTVPPAPNLFEDVLEAHLQLWENRTLSISEHYSFTSAELTSSYLYFRVQNAASLLNPASDQIVLLSSQTSQGHLCAEINAAIARKFLFSREATGDDSVVIEVVPGLEAAPGRFALDLSQGLHQIWDRHPASEHTIVNFTGGFKGLIPALTWRSYRRAVEGCKCTMIYAHERMKSIEEIQFLGPESFKQSLLEIQI